VVVPDAGDVAGSPDATAALERLAVRLEAAHKADPGDAALARVLKDTLLALRGPGEDADDAHARFWADFGGS
jgi:hypothetical protein